MSETVREFEKLLKNLDEAYKPHYDSMKVDTGGEDEREFETNPHLLRMAGTINKLVDEMRERRVELYRILKIVQALATNKK